MTMQEERAFGPLMANDSTDAVDERNGEASTTGRANDRRQEDGAHPRNGRHDDRTLSLHFQQVTELETSRIKLASNDVEFLNTVQLTRVSVSHSMGIKERQERDREAVRRSILDAARDLFVAEGYQNVSIRKIAERIEYSPAAIYSYFPSKDDIFFALADEGFRLLCPSPEMMHANDHLPPLERIREALWGFYEFSVQHPEYFSLMFVDRSVPRISREYERFAFAQEMKAHLLDEVRQCIDLGHFPGAADAHAVLNTLMTGLVGVAVLRLADRLAPGDDAYATARNVLDTTIAGLRSGVAVRRTHPDCPLDEPTARSTGAADSSRSSS